MKVRLFLGATAVLIWGVYANGFCDEQLETGSFSVGGKLQLDWYSHKLGSNWNIFKAGYKGINDNFSYTPSTPTSHSWATVAGQTLFINAGFRPTEHLSGTLGFEFIGAYADRYWLPVNLEHRMNVEGHTFFWNRADITYARDWWKLNYFRNVGHYNWSYDGDLFNLFPEQNEPDRYLRVSGRAVPEGGHLNMQGKAGKLDLYVGPEVVWDYRNGVYANYARSIDGHDTHLIYRDHIIPYGDPDERMRSAEVSTNFAFNDHSLLVGLLYQPFRLNRDYVYVDDTAPGQGVLGTRYLKKTGTTGTGDAFGASTKLTLTEPVPFLNQAVISYTYQGLVAGNKQEGSAQVTRKMSRSLTGMLEFMYRKPLLGPVPLVLEGTPGNTGPAILEPRGPDSPFWVGWGNEATGWENRETSILSLVFTFDPTPGTWFYRYQPNIAEEWNLNPDENAPLSFATRLSLTRYPSSTDRLLYWDINGHMVWEPPMHTEPWPTNGYIGSFNLLGRYIITDWKFLFEIGTGESPALTGFAYTTATNGFKPITGYFVTGLAAETGPFTARVRYAQDAWGPEDWNRRFGETYDRLYQVSVSRTFNEYFGAGIEYVGAHEVDKRFLTPDIGDFDEVRFYFALSFGPVIVYHGTSAPQVEEPEPAGQQPESDVSAPQVKLRIPEKQFIPSEKPLVMEPWAGDPSGIASWQVIIADPRGSIIKTISGDGRPPFSIEWDGKDDIYGTAVPEGRYIVEFSAVDQYNNVAKSDPVEIIAAKPAPPAVVEPPKDLKVTETERGLLVSFTSRVLFDTGRSLLKPGSDRVLDELVNILKTYRDNKIAVEGHTDSVGGSSYNQKLSEQRAWSVANYLIKAGIDAERIKVAGYGKERPVASNATPAGREANRRVEVIILKK